VLGGVVYIVGAGYESVGLLRFDPASEAWSTLASTSIKEDDGGSFVLDGCLYAMGNVENNSVERYDVASDSWEAVADMPEQRWLCGAVTIGSAGPVEEQDLFDTLIAKATKNRP
jgi:hypothetical protein